MVDEWGDTHYAGFWRRVGAFVADTAFLAAVTYLLLYALYGDAYFYWLKNSDGLFASYAGWDALLNNVLPVLFTVVCWVKFRGTPGKLLFGCHVLDAATLQPVTPGQAVLRYIAYLVSLLPLGLGFIWVAIDKRKQGFHDKIARTVVMREDEFRDLYKELDKERLRQ